MEASKLVIRAAKQGDLPVLKALLAEDPGLLDARDTDGSTPLHCAAWKGNDEAVALLLAMGADVSAQNENDHWGGTPLHAAAHANNREVARMLLEHGADVTAVNRNGRTPMDETAFHNATAVRKLLQQHVDGAAATG